MKHPLFENANLLEKICLIFLLIVFVALILSFIAVFFLLIWQEVSPIAAVICTLIIAALTYLTRSSKKIAK